MTTLTHTLLCLAFLCWLGFSAVPSLKTKAGELVIDPPTLINLGFEWLIEGDDNRNASVEVSYRRAGETQWKQGLPLLRLQGERIFQTEGVFDVVSPNMFAGSILDPGTGYRLRGQVHHVGPRRLQRRKFQSYSQDRHRAACPTRTSPDRSDGTGRPAHRSSRCGAC